MPRRSRRRTAVEFEAMAPAPGSKRGCNLVAAALPVIGIRQMSRPHIRRETPVPGHGSLPSYEKLFGAAIDESRGRGAVRSIRLPPTWRTSCNCWTTGSSTPRSRRAGEQIKDIPLDAANTFTEVPYLDIVNEVLAGQLRAEPGKDAYTAMTGMTAPVRHALLARRRAPPHVPAARRCRAGRLYRRFATDADAGRRRSGVSGPVPGDPRPGHDARRRRGRRQGLTTGSTGPTSPRCKPVDAVPGGDRADRPRELAAAALRPARAPRPSTDVPGTLRAERWRPPSSSTRAAAGHGERRRGRARLGRRAGVRAVALVRAGQPVRPARPRRRATVHRPRPRAAEPVRQRPGPRGDPDLAVVRYLASALELPWTSSAASSRPWTPSGIGDGDAPADLFDRTFNGRCADIETTVVPGSGFVARAHRGHRCSPAPGRPARAAATPSSAAGWSVRSGLSETDLAEIVQPVPAALPTRCGRPARSTATRSACRRCRCCTGSARLTGALSLAPDRAVRRAGRPERRPVDRAATTPSTCSSMRRPGSRTATGSSPAAPVADGLWLVQTLVAVVRWMQATDLTAPSSTRSSAARAEPAQDAERRRGGRRARRALPAVPARAAGTRGLRLRPVRRAVRAGRPRRADSPAAAPSPRATRGVLVRVDDPPTPPRPPPTPACCGSR